MAETFESMKVGELKEIALKKFPEDEEDIQGWTKNETLAALKEIDYTYGTYRAELRAEEEAVALANGEELPETPPEEPEETQAAVKSGEKILVRMRRENPSYEIYGYKFTKEHPFVAMSVEDAQLIFDTEDGFTPATPREAENYYN